MPDYLGPEWIIQECESTQVALRALKEWLGENENAGHVILAGPPGSGKTHILDGVIQSIAPAARLCCQAGQSRIDEFLGLVSRTSNCRVIVDDVDEFDKPFWSALLGSVVAQGHLLCATATTFVGRLERLWKGRLRNTTSLTLLPVSDRAPEITAFIARSLAMRSSASPEAEALRGLGELLSAAGLERGFHDVEELVTGLMESGADFNRVDAPIVLRILRQVQGRTRKVPVILVEGQTDERYLRWAASFSAGEGDGKVDIEACGSAANVSIRAVELRNEGRAAVALFDYDRPGQRHHKDLAEWGLASVIIPHANYPTKDSLLEHVNIVVEIEDLIPVADLKRFYSANPDRLPELKIEVPRHAFERLVVHSSDKLPLADWVCSTLDRGSAESLFALYNDLRSRLRLPPADWER
jgi:DNA polymerase III delta prime subunit